MANYPDPQEFVFAVPGAHSVIDFARADGRSQIEGETLAEVQARYPGAEYVTWDAWRADAAARQDTPIIWITSDREQYEEMLNVLPPIGWDGGSWFLVGEASDHSMATGRPRFSAYRRQGDAYETASRPVTVAEFRAMREAR